MTITKTETGIEYRVRSSGHIAHEDVPRVAAELARLASAHGQTLSPASVVGAASDPQSALHRYFDWDDATAAREHRLNQARAIIRSIQVNVITQPGPNPERAWTRQYHHVRVSEPDDAAVRLYVPLEIVAARAGMLAQVIDAAQRELVGWRERARTYQRFEAFRRFGDVIAAIDRIEQRPDTAGPALDAAAPTP